LQRFRSLHCSCVITVPYRSVPYLH
jgi:hypothetical protein